MRTSFNFPVTARVALATAAASCPSASPVNGPILGAARPLLRLGLDVHAAVAMDHLPAAYDMFGGTGINEPVVPIERGTGNLYDPTTP